jgi:hypothetical protein
MLEASVAFAYVRGSMNVLEQRRLSETHPLGAVGRLSTCTPVFEVSPRSTTA